MEIAQLFADARADLAEGQDQGCVKEGTAERYDKRLYKVVKRVEDIFRPIVEEIEELEQTQSDAEFIRNSEDVTESDYSTSEDEAEFTEEESQEEISSLSDDDV